MSAPENLCLPLIAQIERTLAASPPAPVWIGFSAGMDSSTLLACAARSPIARKHGLHAIHVHHGLHADADHWAEQAVAFAALFDVPCTVRRVQIDPRGQGLEAAARSARHGVFAEVLTPEATLLLAHHREDQAETLLLRMLRGASVDGLGAMRPLRRCGQGWLARPWLSVSRTDISAAAKVIGLSWIEDPANHDLRHDRSFLRQNIWPLLDQRFPALAERLARLAEHAASVSDELERSAALALANCATSDGRSVTIDGLLALEDALFGSSVRRFARELGVAPPGFHELQRLRREVLLAQQDANPILRWDGHEFRRFRNQLYLLTQAATLPAPAIELVWEAGQSSINLPADLGQLQLLDANGLPGLAPVPLQVRWRRGGERLRPVGKPHRRELRLLFQELGVPPWQRERVPLLFAGRELLSAAGIVDGAGLAAHWPGLRVIWVSATS